MYSCIVIYQIDHQNDPLSLHCVILLQWLWIQYVEVNSLKSQIKTVLTDDEDSKIGCDTVVEGYYENNPYSLPQLNP